MKRLHKYLRVSSLYLAGLVFMAHLIIPHDHHDVYSSHEKDIACPETADKPATGHGFPWHCHAFNDLLPEKIFKLIAFDRITVSDFDFAGPLNPCHSNIGEPVQIFLSSVRLIPSSHKEAPTSLRAPPVSRPAFHRFFLLFLV